MIIDNYTFNFEYKDSGSGKTIREGEKFEVINFDATNGTLSVLKNNISRDNKIEGYQIVRATSDGEFFSARNKVFSDFDKTLKDLIIRCKRYPEDVCGLFASYEKGSFLLFRVVFDNNIIEVHSKDKHLFSVVDGKIDKKEGYCNSNLDEIFSFFNN